MEGLVEGKRRQRTSDADNFEQHHVDMGQGHGHGHGHAQVHAVQGTKIVDWARGKWLEIERSPYRVYLGVLLCAVGITAGGAVFPLMEMYEEPPLLKVGSRNMVLAIGFVSAWRHSVHEVDAMRRTVTNAFSSRHVSSLMIANGVAHAAASLLGQFALDLTGDEVTAVLTNCSCVFAVLCSYLHDPNSITDIEKKAAVSLGVVILYFLVVMRPSFLGVVASLGVALVNAVYYIGQKRLRLAVPFLPLMSMMYFESALCIFLSCLYLHPEFGFSTWFYVMLNLQYLLPTLVVSLCTAVFQGSLVLALSYCSPIVVTGSLSLEPLTTLLFDWGFGRPTPDLHTLLIFLSLIACTAVVSLSGVQAKPTRGFK